VSYPLFKKREKRLGIETIDYMPRLGRNAGKKSPSNWGREGRERVEDYKSPMRVSPKRRQEKEEKIPRGTSCRQAPQLAMKTRSVFVQARVGDVILGWRGQLEAGVGHWRNDLFGNCCEDSVLG